MIPIYKNKIESLHVFYKLWEGSDLGLSNPLETGCTIKPLNLMQSNSAPLG